jgi:hypothetical protein
LRWIEFRPKPDARYRTIAEPEIVALLLLVSWAYEVEAGESEVARAATIDALDTWVGHGLGYRLGSGGVRYFDPVEVINFLKWAALTGGDRYWEDHFVKTHRGFVAEFQPGRIEESSSTAGLPRRFRVRLRRSFDLQTFADDATIRLRLPLPLASENLSDLQVTPELPETNESKLVLRDQCLEMRIKTPACRTITIGAEFAFTASTSAPRFAPLTPRESEIYLRKSEGLIRVTPRVEALAMELSALQPSAQGAAGAFWGYMMETLCSGMVRYSDVPAEAPGDWVLDNGWYDCQLGSALFVALCRARGIPARIVSGHCLYRVQPISHYWSEIWLDGLGWRPFDVICWDLSRGGLDRKWRDVFAGQIDYRLVTQIFPLTFTGPMSVHFPQAWHMIQTAAGAGVDTAYTNAEDGSLIYRDHVEVDDLGAAHVQEGCSEPDRRETADAN